MSLARVFKQRMALIYVCHKVTFQRFCLLAGPFTPGLCPGESLHRWAVCSGDWSFSVFHMELTDEVVWASQTVPIATSLQF